MLHPARAKTTLVQGKAVALKCLSTVGLFCVPTHNPLPPQRNTYTGAGSHPEPHSADLPRVRGEGFCVLSLGPHLGKLPLAASMNNLPLWLLPGKSFKKQAGMLGNHMADLETQQALMGERVR